MADATLSAPTPHHDPSSRHRLTAVPGRPAHHPDPAVDRAVGTFLDRYDNPATIQLYGIHLRVLLDWLHTQGIHPLHVRRGDLEAFMRHLARDRGNRPSSIAQRMIVIRHWYELLLDDDLVTKNPARLLRLPTHQPDEANLVGLSLPEYAAVLRAAEQAGPDRWALVALMGYMGLRVSEACAVNVEDYAGRVQRGHYVLEVLGKGSKPATIPIPVPVLRALDAAAGGRTEGPLLRTRTGARLERRSALRWVTTLGKRAGVERITCHALRRTYVTLALDAGVDVRDVQRGARHASMETTMRYDRARNQLDRHANHTLSAYLSGAI